MKKISFLQKFLFCLFICLLFFFLCFLVYNHFSTKDLSPVSAPEAQSTEPEPKTSSVFVSAIGDIMCHNTQYQDAYDAKTNIYDFSYVFSDIAPLLEEKDLLIGNLETTFAGSKKGYSSYPSFNTPEQLATNLKNLGIDVVSTANNHCMDTGFSGLTSTLDQLDKVGISHVGTARNEEEQDTILIKEINGIKIAFFSYTYGTNGIKIPEDKSYSVNLIDKNLILQQIEKAEQEKVDVMIANVHWGIEYRLEPTTEQEELATFLFENGIDIILGSHPHVLEPMEKRKITTVDAKEKECFVIYSLGNFMSGQTKENTRNSIILNFTITKKENKGITITDIDYIPIYCYTSNGNFKGYKLLDLEKQIQKYDQKDSSLISSNKIDTLRKELEKIHKIMTSRNFK